jgi:TP901 family phage tail tape measure protein
MPTLAELEVWITANDAEAKKAIQEIDQRLHRFEKDGTRRVNAVADSFENFGQRATAAGAAMMPASLAVAAIGGYAINTAAEYQRMGNIFQSVSGASVFEMEKVRLQAMALGADLKLPGTSAKDAMATMVELSKAGLTAAEAMESARGSIMLAAAGGIQNARAAEIQANALNAFSLEAAEAGRVADIFARAANASSAGVEDLAQAFQAGAATASLAGLSIEEYTGALAAMANAGIKGSDAGTSVKSMLSSLRSPAKDAAKALNEIGLKVFDAAGASRPFLAVIQDLSKKLSVMTDERKANIMTTIFGSDGIRAAAILSGVNSEFGKLVENLGDAEGSAEKMSESMNKGLLGALDALRSSVETLLLGEGDKGLPGLEKAVRGIAEAVSSLADAPPIVKDLALGFGAFLLVVPPTLMAVGSMASGVGALATLLGVGATSGGTLAGGLSGATIAMQGFLATVVPIGAAVAATFATIFLGIEAVKNDWMGAGKVWEAVTRDFQAALRGISREWASFADDHMADLQAIGGLFKDVVGVVVVGALRAVQVEIQRFSAQAVLAIKVADFFADAWREASRFTIGTWNTLGLQARRIFEEIKAFAIDMATGVLTAVESIVSPLAGVLGLDSLNRALVDAQSNLRGMAASSRSAAQGLGKEITQAWTLLDLTEKAARRRQSSGGMPGANLALLHLAPDALGGGGKPQPRNPATKALGGIGARMGGKIGGAGNGTRPSGRLSPSANLRSFEPVDPFSMGFRDLQGNTVGAEHARRAAEANKEAILAARRELERVKEVRTLLMSEAQATLSRIASVGASLEDQISWERFGKSFASLTDEKNRLAVSGLAKSMSELATAQERASASASFEAYVKRLKDLEAVRLDPSLKLVEASGVSLDQFRLLSKEEQNLIKANEFLRSWQSAAAKMRDAVRPTAEVRSGPGGGGPMASLGEGMSLAADRIKVVLKSHSEYMASLENERAMILAVSEVERIRLDLSHQNQGWTSAMVAEALQAQLEVQAVRVRADEIQSIVGRLNGWIEGSLDGLYEKGFGGFFDNVRQGFSDMLYDMARQWVMAQIQMGLTRLVAGIVGGGGGGGAVYRSPVSPPVPGRAVGGPLAAGQVALMGENGPELVYSAVNSRVFSATETRQILDSMNESRVVSAVGGGGDSRPVVVNVTISATDAGSFRNSARQVREQLAEAVRQGLRG